MFLLIIIAILLFGSGAVLGFFSTIFWIIVAIAVIIGLIWFIFSLPKMGKEGVKEIKLGYKKHPIYATLFWGSCLIFFLWLIIAWMTQSSNKTNGNNATPIFYNSTSTNQGTSINTHATSTQTLDSFKTSYQREFIKSCESVAGGTNVNSLLCTCVASYMVTNYNNVQLTGISAKGKISGKVPQEITNAVNSCESSNPNISDQTALEITYGNNFMNICNPKRDSHTQCSCVLTYLRKNYTLVQRAQMDIDYNRTKQLPQAMNDAVSACTTSNSNQ